MKLIDETRRIRVAYAHSRADAKESDWHTLRAHLEAVAKLASERASKWGAGEWGHYAGLWHDLGKFAPDWQEFLRKGGAEASVAGDEQPDRAQRGRRRGPDHSTAGALHARETFGRSRVANVLEFVIAAHHAGLADEGDLRARLAAPEKLGRYRMAVDAAETPILGAVSPPAFPPFLTKLRGESVQKRSFEFLTRMIFSALCDADFLDTESFMEHDAQRSSARRGWRELHEYIAPLDHELARLAGTARGSERVRGARGHVLAWCRAAATAARGAFTLTVPTGGGKTLASLAFALDHAVHHHLDRVIVVLPFLSIIDQTAAVLRDLYEPLFGSRVLIEHHSSVTPERDTQANRLASENWDAPLVVTTQVQFFESLFARRPGDCRKLHNIANSVVILDEVQTLPIGLLDPMLDALQELSTNYGTTLLLTTATQPAFHSRPLGGSRFAGLTPAPREIVPAGEIEPLFDSLRRVEVEWPRRTGSDFPEPGVPWPALASDIAKQRQVLAIVHRRDDARDLFSEVQRWAPDAVHLSALMCAAHRRRVLAGIRQRLDDGEVCRVVSTQLVEAGVDVDFPVVYRAMAGLESLAQSAGRCNRNGALERGRFVVFDAPTEPPRSLKLHRDIAEVMVDLAASAGDPLDLFSPGTFRSYFARLYAVRGDRDEHHVQQARAALQYETTSTLFRMIPDATTTVFVPYGRAGSAAIARFRRTPPTRETLRHLQPFGVSVYDNDLRELTGRGA
ncbi:MAG: CRISPR-associated protein Cas3, partial [Acidobacteria bacterium]|nr:CRISPR-associated protein Cas3 [Acidobacteriota bacterium]